MALTESFMLPLETKAPDFNLPNVIDGKYKSLNKIKGLEGTLIIFMCNHCPYVIHLLNGILKISEDFQKKGINTIAISSNSVKTHPQDGPEEMEIFAKNNSFSFPYLFDETQEVAKNYQAACTPDFYLFDKNLELYYRGRFDSSRPGNNLPVTGEDLNEAAELMLSKLSYNQKQYPSMGCNIKWNN